MSFRTCSVTSTSALLELYSRLLASANFRTWLAIHRQPYLHLLAPPSKPLTSVTSDTFNFNSDEEGDVLVVAAGGPKNVQEGSKRVGGEAWFAHAREHMDEGFERMNDGVSNIVHACVCVRACAVEFINLFFTQEQLLREAQSSAYAFASPNAEELVARLRSELVNLLLGINQRDLQLICISAPQRKALLLEISRDLSPSQQKTIQDLLFSFPMHCSEEQSTRGLPQIQLFKTLLVITPVGETVYEAKEEGLERTPRIVLLVQPSSLRQRRTCGRQNYKFVPAA
eukprot:1152083-Pelagomonas_calceolata.AAC.10